MYQNEVLTKEQAVIHLFFHCCFKDELATEPETSAIADKIVTIKLHHDLNVKEEVRKYKAYQPMISSDQEYIGYLIGLISTKNKLALYSFCVELCLTDLALQPEEENLLAGIADALGLSAAERQIINDLLIQRKIVESGAFF